jgi:hypothetical protein
MPLRSETKIRVSNRVVFVLELLPLQFEIGNLAPVLRSHDQS